MLQSWPKGFGSKVTMNGTFKWFEWKQDQATTLRCNWNLVPRFSLLPIAGVSFSTGAAIIMTGRREPWERGWYDSSLLAWEQPRSPGRSWNWPMHNPNAYTTHRPVPRISRNVLRSWEKGCPVLSQEFTYFFDEFVPSTFESSQLISVYIRRQDRVSVIVGTRDVSISSAYKIDSKRQTNASTPPKAIERIRFTWSTGSSG